MSKRFYGGIFYEPKLMIELGVEHPKRTLRYTNCNERYNR